ncbi:MAG: S26 family signal peptidase [Paracoccaceae bacterium]|nr:S26 family signal peptidase [Paracoccaceae bacterium]
MTGTRKKITVGLLGAFVLIGFYALSAGRLVLNGTRSLPHTGYLMVSWPILPLRGSYVAFPSPHAVDARFQDFPFVKQIVGLPGDMIISSDAQVCVAGTCRTLLPKLAEKGLKPLSEGVVEADELVVFGDAPDSLDSRYALIGTVARSDILAVGYPVPIPHWTEWNAWAQ